jgi:hypothetical protein
MSIAHIVMSSGSRCDGQALTQRVGLQFLMRHLRYLNMCLTCWLRPHSEAIAASNDVAPYRSVQATITNLARSMAFFGGGGLIQTTSRRSQQRVLWLQR